MGKGSRSYIEKRYYDICDETKQQTGDFEPI